MGVFSARMVVLIIPVVNNDCMYEMKYTKYNYQNDINPFIAFFYIKKL